MNTWTVYVHRDKDDNPLYVGYSRDLARRTYQHSNRSHWWDQVVSVEERHTVESEEHAQQVETETIKALRPRYNRCHNRPPRTVHNVHLPDDVDARLRRLTREEMPTLSQLVTRLLIKELDRLDRVRTAGSTPRPT